MAKSHDSLLPGETTPCSGDSCVSPTSTSLSPRGFLSRSLCRSPPGLARPEDPWAGIFPRMHHIWHLTQWVPTQSGLPPSSEVEAFWGILTTPGGQRSEGLLLRKTGGTPDIWGVEEKGCSSAEWFAHRTHSPLINTGTHFSESSKVVFFLTPLDVSMSAQAHLPRLVPRAQAATLSASGPVHVISRLSGTLRVPHSASSLN